MKKRLKDERKEEKRMKKLNKRIRHSENAFSVERYDICSAQAENQWCIPQCNYNGSNPYAMGLVRDDRYQYFKAIFED